MKRIILILALVLGSVSLAQAQGTATQLCFRTNPAGGCQPVDASNPLPTYQVFSATSSTNITTATDTDVKSSAGTLVSVIVNTGDAASTAAIYDDADGTCSSGLIATLDTSAITSVTYNLRMSNGICVTTSGTADITVTFN